MKTRKPIAYYILLFVGAILMAGFGSEIANTIALPKSGAGHLLLPGYSVGLLMICGSMFTLLGAQVRDLQSRVEELNKHKS
jgi:hypothetical protein